MEVKQHEHTIQTTTTNDVKVIDAFYLSIMYVTMVPQGRLLQTTTNDTLLIAPSSAYMCSPRLMSVTMTDKGERNIIHLTQRAQTNTLDSWQWMDLALSGFVH